MEIFLADTWVFWYDDSLKGNQSEYDINVKVLGEFSTIQVFINNFKYFFLFLLIKFSLYFCYVHY